MDHDGDLTQREIKELIESVSSLYDHGVIMDHDGDPTQVRN
jgi:hypothetical protein